MKSITLTLSLMLIFGLFDCNAQTASASTSLLTAKKPASSVTYRIPTSLNDTRDHYSDSVNRKRSQKRPTESGDINHEIDELQEETFSPNARSLGITSPREKYESYRWEDSLFD